jgi:DoxX-like family
MRTSTTRTVQRPTHEAQVAVVARHSTWSRVRLVVFWVMTFVIVFELAAGSVWNLVPIDWVEIQLQHLGYPHYLAYILGVWQAAAAVVIIVPGFALLKEWAYAGAFFLWSGAVASHLAFGDGPESWGAPLIFAMCAVVSWALRPADRRLTSTFLPGNAGQEGSATPGIRPAARRTRPRAWAVTIGLLVAMFAVSIFTLPVVDVVMHEQAIERGWIDE